MSFSTIAYNILHYKGESPALYCYNNREFTDPINAKIDGLVTVENYFQLPGMKVEDGKSNWESLGWAEQFNTVLPFLGSIKLLSIIIRFHGLEDDKWGNKVEIKNPPASGPNAHEGKCGGTLYARAMEGDKERIIGGPFSTLLSGKTLGHRLDKSMTKPEGFEFAQVIAKHF